MKVIKKLSDIVKAFIYKKELNPHDVTLDNLDTYPEKIVTERMNQSFSYFRIPTFDINENNITVNIDDNNVIHVIVKDALVSGLKINVEDNIQLTNLNSSVATGLIYLTYSTYGNVDAFIEIVLLDNDHTYLPSTKWYNILLAKVKLENGKFFLVEKYTTQGIGSSIISNKVAPLVLLCSDNEGKIYEN